MPLIDSFRNWFKPSKPQNITINQQPVGSVLNGVAVYNKVDANNQLNKGYVTNADVYSIVDRICKHTSIVPVKVVNAQGDHLEAHPLTALLKYPNSNQDEREFNYALDAFSLLTGNYFIYTPLAVNSQPLEMWILPTQNVSPVIDNSKFPHRVLKYRFNLLGVYDFTLDEVLHGKKFNPIINTSGDELMGLSPLQAAAKILQRSEDETDYSVNAFQNSGISGIVTNKSLNYTDADVTELGRIKEQFYADATGKENARKLSFQTGDINYIPIGLSPIDMDVINSEVRTFKRLCNIYGISDILFNNSDASTESNVKEMVKQFYTNCVIPLVEARIAVYNRFLCPKYKDGVKLVADYSGIKELQEDHKMIAEMFEAMPAFIPNEMFKALKMPLIEDPTMDKVYIKQGYVPIEDLQAPTL